jgi:hypothetical protein
LLNTKNSFNTHRSVKQSPYQTMKQNTLAEQENTDLALMKNWDQQKTMPLHARQNSSKKRKSECKKSERKSDWKAKNQSLISTANTKSLRYDLYKPHHQYNQSLNTCAKPSHQSLHGAHTLTKSSNSNTHKPTNNTQNMKSQLSKKLIKNYVKTHRDNEHMITKYDLDKGKHYIIYCNLERTSSKDKKIKTYRKGSNNKINESKRTKSSNDKAIKEQAPKIKRVPKTYQSPSGVSEDSKGKHKVKVYKVDKGQIMNKSTDRNSKHLKSKSQSNFVSDSINDVRNSKPKLSKEIPKRDIYAKNFSSTDYYKYKMEQHNAYRDNFGSPEPEGDKSIGNTVSNFSNTKKIINKVNQAITGNRPQYTRKYDKTPEIVKDNSLIAESGGSGLFSTGRNKGKSLNIDILEGRSGEHSKKDGLNSRNEADNAARMNFYPVPTDEPDLDIDSELNDSPEEFKVTRLQNRLQEKSQMNNSSNHSKEEGQAVIPEYYFDLTKPGNNKPAPKEKKTIPVKTHSLHNVHI